MREDKHLHLTELDWEIQPNRSGRGSAPNETTTDSREQPRSRWRIIAAGKGEDNSAF